MVISSERHWADTVKTGTEDLNCIFDTGILGREDTKYHSLYRNIVP